MDQLTGKRRILLVDDDPLILRIYREGLARQGFQVETASDGLGAIQAMRIAKPDMMVLDLMMPKLSGVEVLKFLRSQPELSGLPVIVFSNAYMTDMTREAASAGAELSLIKARCTPASLASVIRELLESPAANRAPTPVATAAAEPSQPAPAPDPVSTPISTPSPPSPQQDPQARRDFLAQKRNLCAELRGLLAAVSQAANASEQSLRLQNLYRKVHFITAAAGLTGCASLAEMGSIFEALLFGLSGKPSQMSPSLLHTIGGAVEFLGVLFEREERAIAAAVSPFQVLAVDDNALSNRLVISALSQANLQTSSVENPLTALKLLKQARYDLVVVDIDMPGMDGFELCRQMRSLPGYGRTPVIYVTSHSEFENYAKSMLTAIDDLLGKPFPPLELAVKALMQLLKRET